MRPTGVCLCDCICICVFMYFLVAYQSGHLIARAPLNTAVCGKLESKQDRIRPGWPVTRRAGTEYWNCRIIYYIMIYHILSYSYHSIFYIFNMDHLGWLHTVKNFSPRCTIVKHFQKQNILYETFTTFDQAFDQIYS